jgi:hypothetical protein
MVQALSDSHPWQSARRMVHPVPSVRAELLLTWPAQVSGGGVWADGMELRYSEMALRS